VPIFVKYDRGEDGEDEDHAVHGIAHCAVKLVARERHPREQDEKGGVHADVDPREASELPRPLHFDVTPGMAPPLARER
jgi:hypothetical protein